MRDSYVPKSYLESLLAQAEAAGCKVDSLLAKVNLDEPDIAERQDVPARKYGEIYRLVMRETQNEWFGMFSGGERVPLGSFRMMGLTVLQCSNLYQATFRASDFAEICRGMVSRFYLSEEGEDAVLSLMPLRSVDPDRFQRMINESEKDAILTYILTWHRFCEWLIDKEIPLLEIGLSASKDEIHTPLAYTKLGKVTFNSDQNYMRFSSEFLQYPIVQSQDSLTAFLRSAPYHLVTPDPAHVTPAEKVRSILNRDVSRAMPSAEEVASQLHVSVTTLRRQLQREGTSFQKIKDKCRLEAAYHYLNYAELSNNDIAEKLGFDEPSAFFRSFKKWTGKTPGEYRADLR